TTGYVWVMATMDMVYFFCRESREGSFLRDLLSEFDGVLVSDFFTAYDSLPCKHQKCLVHLMRDINDDMRRNPFDTDLRLIGEEFGQVLATAVSSIDRWGLKAYHLRKHRKQAERMLTKIGEKKFRSECAQSYQKRFVKYASSLFAFLTHDNVPWNNNNAEHAIKHFARYRREVDGKVTQSGVSNYLVLLSVYMTCKYRGVNCLDFMLSGCRDLFEFCGQDNLPRSPKSER
ncbi:MAG: transposase, partial [Planctomycetes bacterium]|nr:transposase [Planctomycetota bacterium]